MTPESSQTNPATNPEKTLPAELRNELKKIQATLQREGKNGAELERQSWLRLLDLDGVGLCQRESMLEANPRLREWLRQNENPNYVKKQPSLEHPINVEGQPHPLRSMPSWMDLDQMEIDPNKYLIGDGLLEPGGYIVLVGASYTGKSTLCAQLSMNLAIGRSAFCFPVRRPLRSLIVQAEDLQNKLIKMGHMSRRMGFSQPERDMVGQNTAVLTLRDVQDQAAIREIERHALVFQPDIIWLNPLTSFLSHGVYKDDEINKFLRAYWTPMLDRLQCGGFPIHHPPKPGAPGRETPTKTPYERQYEMSGMAAITNNSRGNVFLDHVAGDVFKLAIGKGFEEVDPQNSEAYIRRSKQNGIMLWEPCDPDQAQLAIEQNEARRRSIKPGPKSAQAIDVDKILTVLYSHDEKGGLCFKELERFTSIKRSTLQRRLKTLLLEANRLYLSTDGNYALTPTYRISRDKASGQTTDPPTQPALSIVR